TPRGIAAPMCRSGFERWNHGVALKDRANDVEAVLQFVGVRLLPANEHAMDCGGIHVGRSTDTACGSVAQAPQLESFAARKDVEVSSLKPFQQSRYVLPVARRVLNAGDVAGIAIQESINQVQADTN